METLESTITGTGEIKDQNKAIVREFFAAVDSQDFEKLNELLADDFVLKAPGLAQPWAKEDVFKNIMQYYTAFPDWTHSIEELIAEGDNVAVKLLQRGTHTAAYEGLKPSGKEVTKPGIHIITITDFKIREWLGIEEELGFMLQLGMELKKKNDMDVNIIKNDLRSMEVNHKTAVDKKDIEGILQFYAEDLIHIPQEEPILYGRDLVRNLLVDLFNTYDFHEDFKFFDVRVIGEHIAASYTFEQRMTPLTGGDMIIHSGKGLCILKRSESGNWQFEWNSSSYNNIRAETKKAFNIDLATKFNAYLDEQNFDGLRSISHPGLKIWYESGEPASLNDMEPFVKSYYQSFPDYIHLIDDAFAADDKVVVRLSFSGTHSNDFSGIKPTGKKFRYKGIQIFQFKDDKICNLWIVEDELSMMTQLGLQLS